MTCETLSENKQKHAKANIFGIKEYIASTKAELCRIEELETTCSQPSATGKSRCSTSVTVKAKHLLESKEVIICIFMWHHWVAE